MSVPALTIADAVTAALNAATLSQAVTFERVYVPKFDTTVAATIQGKVVPKSDVREMGSATCDNATLTIDIGVMKKLDQFTTQAAENAELDAIMELCEEVKAVVNRKRFGAADEFVGVAPPSQEIPYSVDDVEERVFLTLIEVDFMTTVAA